MAKFWGNRSHRKGHQERWRERPPNATRIQVSTGGEAGYGYQWWIRPDGTFEGRGIYGQTLHIDRARRLVIVITSATEQPTGRVSADARQDFIAAVKATIGAER